ncbi:uncharacterized protein LOC130996650 [Salvia miltiorrhiza]|uniref:uncharacterized protein LOC130996650 n=1 Tax=Salvia miltiorrhiza TaxID=226208 RepID=UPI0025AB898C|nr:uncharacterized protein LOC130996650 [Salvia miltiorrhiza]
MGGDSASSGCEGFLEETREASPANLLIKVESFSSFSVNHGLGNYESRAFEAGGYKWKLIIFPEGKDEGCHVSVHLCIAETSCLAVGWEINVIFAFFVYNHRMENYLCFRGTTRRFNAVVPKLGFSKLISKKSLMDPSKGFVVDDSCVFGAEVFVIKPQRINECLSLVKLTAPTIHEWKISGFSKLINNSWTSEEFVVGNYKWNVTLYSKGDAKANGKYISIFLSCNDSNSFAPNHRLKAEICLRIKTKLGLNHTKNFSHWFMSYAPSVGYSDFMAVADMNDPSKGFVVGDCCILETEGSVAALVLDAPKI